jgi:hypothetical protein
MSLICHVPAFRPSPLPSDRRSWVRGRTALRGTVSEIGREQ